MRLGSNYLYWWNPLLSQLQTLRRAAPALPQFCKQSKRQHNQTLSEQPSEQPDCITRHANRAVSCARMMEARHKDAVKEHYNKHVKGVSTDEVGLAIIQPAASPAHLTAVA